MMVLIVTIKIIITIILIIECVYNDANGPIVMIRAHYRNQSLIVLSPPEQPIGRLRFPPAMSPRSPPHLHKKRVIKTNHAITPTPFPGRRSSNR